MDQNSDFAAHEAPQPRNDCFMGTVPVSVEARFLGCDSIAAGEEVSLSFAREGDVVTETTTLSSTLYRGDLFTYDFNTPLQMAGYLGVNDIDAWVNYGSDSILGNDSLEIELVNPLLMRFNNILTFEAADASRDSFYALTNQFSDVYISTQADFQSEYGLLMTGGDVQEAFDNGEIVKPPPGDSVWLVNEVLSARSCVCVNATNLTAVELSFDLRQTYSYFFQNNTSENVRQSSSMRVLVNGQQISPTYTPNTHLVDPWQQIAFDLSDFAGSFLEVCFETRNFVPPAYDNIGDKSMIDNVEISGVVSTTDLHNNVFSLSVTPNPNDGWFMVQFSALAAKKQSIRVYDAVGRLVMEQMHEGTSGANQAVVDLSDQGAGLYFLRVGERGVAVVVR